MAKPKRGLGKGLSALIPDSPVDEVKTTKDNEKRIVNLDISLIEPNIYQPRKDFNKEALKELSNSIEIYGIIQPIIVRMFNSGYQIIAGERRWRASKIVGLKEIPCIVKEVEQLQSSEMALIENLQREDLNPIEEAVAFSRLIEKHDLTQDKISQIVGKSRSYIANIMRLLNLDQRVIDLISKGEISSGHGRTLLPLENNVLQYKVAKIIIDKNLSVRETEKLVKDMTQEKEKTKKKSVKDPVIINIEDSLRKILGTKVQITKKKNKGKIEIEYYSDEDLERIVELLNNN